MPHSGLPCKHPHSPPAATSGHPAAWRPTMPAARECHGNPPAPPPGATRATPGSAPLHPRSCSQWPGSRAIHGARSAPACSRLRSRAEGAAAAAAAAGQHGHARMACRPHPELLNDLARVHVNRHLVLNRAAATSGGPVTRVAAPAGHGSAAATRGRAAAASPRRRLCSASGAPRRGSTHRQMDRARHARRDGLTGGLAGHFGELGLARGCGQEHLQASAHAWSGTGPWKCAGRGVGPA